jgi:hypothetical protein
MAEGGGELDTAHRAERRKRSYTVPDFRRKLRNLLANLAVSYYFHGQTRPSSLMTPGALSFDDPIGFDEGSGGSRTRAKTLCWINGQAVEKTASGMI